MIDCPNGDVRDVLPDYVNARLDAARHAAVERHLLSCEACREEVELLRDLRATMLRAPVVNVDAIAAAIPAHRAPARRGWTTSWRAVAAIVAIAIGGTSIALLRDDAPTDSVARPAQVVVEPRPAVDSSALAVSPGDSGASSRRTIAARPAAPVAPAAQPRELAMAGGTIGDLSDVELSALVEGIESLDALPSADVDDAEPASVGAQEES
jgi:anti-sigma factor RsiW